MGILANHVPSVEQLRPGVIEIIEESAGALVGSESLKDAGKEDQLKGAAREAWGNVKDAGDALIDQARAAKYDAEAKTDRAQAFTADHKVEVVHE